MGYAARCAGAIQGKKGGIQVLAGLAPSSLTVGSNISVIHEQERRSSRTTDVNITLVTWQQSLVSGIGRWLGGQLAARLREGEKEVS